MLLQMPHNVHCNICTVHGIGSMQINKSVQFEWPMQLAPTTCGTH